MKVKFLNGSEKEIADLYGADLRGADLRGADLRGADLYGADLRGADLRGADLYGTNLRGARLYGADLRGAHLYGTDLRGARLYGADLRGAHLYGAHLRGADLRGADLRGARGLESFTLVAEGVLIGYKKLANGNIAKLRIPLAAARVNAYGSRKCRAAYATVISGTGVSKHDGVTKYAPKLKVVADKFDPDPRVECSGGIHFFITEQEAKDY
jgi:hypothetical protein